MRHTSRPLPRLKTLACTALLALLAACSTVDRGKPPALESAATWAVLPFANHTETPLAGNRAEAIAEALLHAQGVGQVKRYQGNTQQEALFDAGSPRRLEEALA